MEAQRLIEADWPLVLSLLPQDLEETAREFGALLRKRKIKSAVDLLRLGLAYSICGLSLRTSVVWSEQEEIATFSNVAVLKRLRGAADWFSHLLCDQLAQRNVCLPKEAGTFRIRLLDATAVCLQGSNTTDWRIHVGFDLAQGKMDEILVTDYRVGESLDNFAVSAGDVFIADRGYVSVEGVRRVKQAQGDIILRLPSSRASVYDAQGERIALLPLFKNLKQPGESLDVAVSFGKGKIATPGRLIALAKTPEATEYSQRKVKEKARKNGTTASEESLAMAAYFFVFTTLLVSQASTKQVLELYRFRWQIELNFKRLKSILKLDEMAAHDPLVCRALLSLKLLAALLIEDLSERFRSFSPWGYGQNRLVPLAGVPGFL